MQFLRILFWVLIAVLLTVFASNNWRDVEINLWANLRADIKLPVLILITFLIGFLPPWLILRGKLWRLNRRLAGEDQSRPVPPAPAAPSVEDGAEA
jgi:lipopolysaccharide assembly protein A